MAAAAGPTWRRGGLGWVLAARHLADVAQPLEAVGGFPFAVVVPWKRESPEAQPPPEPLAARNAERVPGEASNL